MNYSGPSIIQTPLVIANSSSVQIIEMVRINEMAEITVMAIDNFPVISAITSLELLYRETQSTLKCNKQHPQQSYKRSAGLLIIIIFIIKCGL